MCTGVCATVKYVEMPENSLATSNIEALNKTNGNKTTEKVFPFFERRP